MKTVVFLCLRGPDNSKGCPVFVRARMTVDSEKPSECNMYFFPGSEHHSCKHEPKAVSQEEFLDMFEAFASYVPTSSLDGSH